MRSRWHPATCRYCNGHRDDVGPISARGKCAGCGEKRLAEYQRQMRAKSGPMYEAYRSRLLSAHKAG